MTLNAKILVLWIFLVFGLRHKSILFTRWRHWTIVMRSRWRIWYLYINLKWTFQFSANLLNRNCYRLSRVSWALAQISCFPMVTQISDFVAFPNCRKVGKFAASIKRPKTKSASASGELRPPSPWPGALPLDPRYRLALPRSPWRPCPPDVVG